MNFRNTLLYNTLGLPAYWRACRQARKTMQVRQQRISYGPARRQYAIVLEPATGEVRPGHYAFYFHGGAWTFGKPETFVPAAIPWLARGYRVVLPSYRRPPMVGLNRIVGDCKAAIRHLLKKEVVEELHLGGISAGAHLAATLTLDAKLWEQIGVAPSAVLCCAGPLDLGILRPRPLFLPHYAHLNPLAQLRKYAPGDTRWLLLHGDADATVSIEHAHRFYAELQHREQNSKLLVVPNGTHLDSGRWMFGGAGAAEIAAFIAPNPAP